MYLLILTYLLMLYFTMSNLVNYLIKQRRYKNILLSFFYGMALATIFLRLGQYVFIYYTLFFGVSFLEIMPAVLKLEIGLLQAWIMVELTVNLRQSRKQCSLIVPSHESARTDIDEE